LPPSIEEEAMSEIRATTRVVDGAGVFFFQKLIVLMASLAAGAAVMAFLAL
jgi:hypothetical protein